MSRILRLKLNKKGFSSIVGAIFALIAIISLTSAMFVWAINQNTTYNNALRQANQADLDRLNEKALANATASYVNTTAVTVNGILKNVGSLLVTVNTLWVVDTSNNQFNATSLSNLNLKSGTTTNITKTVSLNASSSTDNFLCWFVSSRGNIISQSSLVLANIGNANITNIVQNVNNVTTSGNFTINGNDTTIYNVGGVSTTYANVSQGIGLLAFDFKGFTHKDFSGVPIAGTSLNNSKTTYLFSQTNYTVLHVVLTNYDPDKQEMRIDGNSSIYFIGSAGVSNVKYETWKTVNVTGNSASGYNIYPSQNTVQYVLPYGVPVDVFFAGYQSQGSTADSGVYPLNIMIFGKLGTRDYGQNVPFISIYVV